MKKREILEGLVYCSNWQKKGFHSRRKENSDLEIIIDKICYQPLMNGGIN